MADMASELEAIAFRLRSIGEDGLAREVTAAMRRGVQPVPGEIRAGLKPRLPDPYAETLDADLDLRITARNPGTASADAVLSVTGTTRSGKRRRLRRLDAGILAHPLYGHRKRWYDQGEPSVRPGWFSGPAEAAAPRVLGELEQALRDIAAKAEGK